MPAPTVAGPGDHVYARILTYRGVINTGDPWDVTGGGVKATASTSVTVTGVTTTVPNTLIVQAVSRDNDSAAAAFSAQTNANLTGIAERSDAGTTEGKGGGFAVWDGVKATAGATGNTTATVTSSVNAFLTIALRPSSALTISVPAGTVANDVMIASITYRPCSAASGAACTTTIAPPAGWIQVNTVTDQTTGAGTGGFGNRLFIYRRVATGAEPASYTWTFGGALVHAGAAGGIVSFSGVDTTSPIVAEAGQTTASATSHAAPSINTGAVTNTMLVSSHSANSSTLWTPPAGMTERVDVASLAVPNDLGIALEVNHELRAAAGATGTRTAGWTAPPAADTGITHMLALRPADAVHHYAISVLSASVANCDFAEVTITAHNAAHAAVNPPATRIVTLATSVGTGVWQAGLVTGSGTWTPSGLNNGAATYQWSGGESSFTVRLRQSAVTALSVNLSDGFVVEDPTEDPTISFVNSALRVSNGANAALAIGNQIASKPSNTGVGTQSLFLQAIRTDTATGACVSLFPNGSEVDFEVGAQCNNPAACTQNVTLTTTSPSGNSGSFVPDGAFPATISFRFTTANAEAPFFFSYADAGQITLQFRRLLPAPPAGVFVSGASNAFVTRPFGFRVTDPPSGRTGGGSIVFTSAGTPFNTTLTAVAWESGDDTNNDGVPDNQGALSANAVTPNFGLETTAATATLSRNLAEPAASPFPGTLSGSTGFSGFSGGTRTQSVIFNEVGIIDLLAATTNYLGSGQNVTAGANGLTGVGRFTPHHFDQVMKIHGCTGGATFTYSGQPFATVMATACAAGSPCTITRNYHGPYGFSKDTTISNAGDTTNFTPNNNTTSNNVLSAANFINGSVTQGAVTYTFTSKDTVPEVINLRAIDTDNVSSAGYTEEPAEIRSGRIRILNGYGSELVSLALPMRVGYYAATDEWVTNTQDTCSSVTLNPLSNYQGNLSAPPPEETCVQDSGNPGASGQGCAAAAPVPERYTASPTSGNYILYLKAPGTGNEGSVDVSADLSTKPWLRYDWDDDGTVEDPSAVANFGLFRGSPRHIYQRERY